jgi:hypothetical protein
VWADGEAQTQPSISVLTLTRSRGGSIPSFFEFLPRLSRDQRPLFKMSPAAASLTGRHLIVKIRTRNWISFNFYFSSLASFRLQNLPLLMQSNW